MPPLEEKALPPNTIDPEEEFFSWIEAPMIRILKQVYPIQARVFRRRQNTVNSFSILRIFLILRDHNGKMKEYLQEKAPAFYFHIINSTRECDTDSGLFEIDFFKEIGDIKVV
ncbi:hypothetical protein AVEN_130869-1 [Araneus ventricosus]|uniref:Uncharacterized protein n=1 Tax=Araneus ventricosus TaxID=182803 RepID=A0A4Y2WKN8_ARAVE|nr:hypothetical protein AVEN_87518-1 [Araneus ventricosus]GBO40352.1 hypothetical protein AVEN_130869-1 [Araneus ventricosus]